MVIGRAKEEGILSHQELSELSRQALSEVQLEGKRVLAIIPDSTRSAPVPLFFKLLCEQIGSRAKKLDFLIALGTHPLMSEERILAHLGLTPEERRSKYGGVGIFNHQWDNPDVLTTIGTLSAKEVREISGGLLDEDVPITLNKRVLDYDLLIIVGPVFPHEVVGFSGGNKYLFPGISGPEFLNLFHWLGALITNVKVNGIKDTPVRRMLDRAAELLQVPRICLAMVTTHEGVKGLYIGSPEEAWSEAADLSAKVNIVYKDRTYKKVLGIAPEMYDDIWTAGKVMYKLEPVLADGADLIIYAPHITELSYTHGHLLDKVGYHCRDYFLKQMDNFKDIPRAVLAHSTHVKGLGTFENGVEKPRVNVILATRIPEARCLRINLGYMNPDHINLSDYENREDKGILLVPQAGETLYRLS